MYACTRQESMAVVHGYVSAYDQSNHILKSGVAAQCCSTYIMCTLWQPQGQRSGNGTHVPLFCTDKH